MIRIAKRIIGVLLLLTALFSVSGCWTISKGERIGIVTKFSQKGAVCKTWEGELHFASSTGMLAPDPWNFTVDPYAKHGENPSSIVNQLNEAATSGKRVKLTYAQEMITGPCRADTDYFVTGVQILN